MQMNIIQLLMVAGIGQIGLVLGSTLVPRLLGWRDELEKVSPMIKQMFWVYAIYIFMTNLSFGLLSVLVPEILSDGTMLAAIVTGFISVYWISRLFIQFFYFDRKNFPSGKHYRLGEAALVVLFVFLSAVYGYAFYVNIR